MQRARQEDGPPGRTPSLRLRRDPADATKRVVCRQELQARGRAFWALYLPQDQDRTVFSGRAYIEVAASADGCRF